MGVDFAGLSDHNVINKVYKACLLLFTCLVTKKRGKTKSISFQTFKSTELKNFLRDNSIEWEFYFGKVALVERVLRKNDGYNQIVFKKGYRSTYIWGIKNYYYRNRECLKLIKDHQLILMKNLIATLSLQMA